MAKNDNGLKSGHRKRPFAGVCALIFKRTTIEDTERPSRPFAVAALRKHSSESMIRRAV